MANKLDTINIEPGEKFIIGDRLPIIKNNNIDIEYYEGVDHLQVALVCRTSPKDYVELCALTLLNNILAVGRGSRLITKLRYENGLVYSVGSNVFNTIDWGTLRVSFSCDKDKLEKIKALIFKEFSDLRQNNVTSEELENTKSKISKGSIRPLQTSEAWVDFHENDALFSPSDFHTAEDYINTINKLTLVDIKKVIGKHLLEENFYIAICGDYKSNTP